MFSTASPGKKYLRQGFTVCIIVCALGVTTNALFAELEWPRAWFEPARTASELGISVFHQSPLLDNRDLPPVVPRGCRTIRWSLCRLRR